MVNKLYVLYEHAAGYALFKVKEFEEIAMFLPQVEKATLNAVKFKTFVNLVAFLPFKSGTNALDNINNISEGIIHEDLQAFLETNLPQNVKKSKISVGVGDAKIGAAIQETLGYNCQFTDVVPEILRGIRYHFHELIEGLNLSTLGSAECSLGRSYSRAKVKFNINRADNMVIQSIGLVDQLDKDINTFSMRLKEWYSYHYPELAKIITDNHMYAKVAQLIGDRKEFIAEDEATIQERLEELIQDSSKAQAIISAAKSSMGMDISKIDLINIEYFTTKVISLAEYRRQLMDYLVSRMHNIAPNLSALIGEMVGARLISHAGSLINLSKYPSSTVQILGAEKALFRALKKKGNTPKYGLIYHSTFIGRAGNKNKGKISRFLANKCSIASRIDCFAEDATDVFGQKLKEQVEERLKFLDTGAIPKKNLDVMNEAIEEAAVDIKKRKKKLKKEKKRKLAEMEAADESITTDMNGNHEQMIQADEADEDVDVAVKKPKKKKKKSLNNNDNSMLVAEMA
ncbi:nop56 ribonucleoprotein [Dermatophagoides pteronyssinus]|uniref:Nucleolar protein 56 n=2 Tax=Dermatophagoides pteronyssinus TaxID=6956 RepID=A0A6P6YAW8_DERPT|nr:nucleolar protein 56-like [Dermatophagoides pteronyssinus]KAH9424537.1 snoRNP complex protein nop56 [Dermatophagoides pteronyssinus]